MGPENNRELFELYGEQAIEKIELESQRRSHISENLLILSDLFEEKKPTAHPVVEPALFARLYALSRIERTQMSVAGFNPMEPVDMSSGRMEINAKVAPHHDHFTSNNGQNKSEYRTRIIKIAMPEYGFGRLDDAIEVYGLNVYKELDEASPVQEDVEDPKTADYLALVKTNGRVVEKPKPITGETVVLGVHNKETGDSNLYSVSFVPVDESESAFSTNTDVKHLSDNEVVVTLPDYTQVKIATLKDKQLGQATLEIFESISALKQFDASDSELSESERVAVKTISQ